MNAQRVIDAIMCASGQMPMHAPMHVLSYADDYERFRIVAAFIDINDLNMVLRSVAYTQRQYYRISRKHVIFLD